MAKHKVVCKFKANRDFRLSGKNIGQIRVGAESIIYLYDNGVFRVGSHMVPYTDGRALLSTSSVDRLDARFNKNSITIDPRPSYDRAMYEAVQEVVSERPARTKVQAAAAPVATTKPERLPVEKPSESVVRNERPVNEVAEPKGMPVTTPDVMRERPIVAGDFTEKAETVRVIDNPAKSKILISDDDEDAGARAVNSQPVVAEAKPDGVLEAVVEETPKKRRGRPKKVVVLDDQTTIQDGALAPVETLGVEEPPTE